MAVVGLSLHLSSSESCKTPKQKFISQNDTLNRHINEHCFQLYVNQASHYTEVNDP